MLLQLLNPGKLILYFFIIGLSIIVFKIDYIKNMEKIKINTKNHDIDE